MIWSLIWRLILLAVWVAAMCAFWTAQPAKADTASDYATRNAPRICLTLDAYPSTDGVIGIAAVMVKDGLTSREAGEALAVAVYSDCPRFVPVLEAFVAKYGGRGTVV